MILQLNNISKSYDSSGDSISIEVLKNISIDIEQNNSIAIVGPSGSGKSTLLNIMGTLDDASSGSVQFNDKDISKLSDKQLSELRNSKIGFVFQLHHLLPQLNLLENVLLPTIPLKDKSLKEDSNNRALDLLEKVGLSDRINNRPGQLSGGECQRAAVVRALINKPDIILADEPTGSLDETSAEQIGDLLSKINKEEKVALVIVTHSLELAKKMDRIYKLTKGELVEHKI